MTLLGNASFPSSSKLRRDPTHFKIYSYVSSTGVSTFLGVTQYLISPNLLHKLYEDWRDAEYQRIAIHTLLHDC